MSKQVWGNNTWKLFHTISVKIKDEATYEDIQNVLVIIKDICNNLPCPVCSNHATQLFKSVKLNTIITKTDLIHFLFVFHKMYACQMNPSGYFSQNIANIVYCEKERF